MNFSLSQCAWVSFSIGSLGLVLILVGQWLSVDRRLQNTERKLAQILQHFGIAELSLEPSARVQELAKNPKTKIDAIKAYRNQTGAGLKEAKDVIEKLY